MPNTIKFNIDLVVDGKRQVVQATTDVRKLGEEFKRGQDNVRSFKDAMLTINQVGQAFQNLGNSIRQVTGVLNELSAAYNVQAQAETQLATAMRNTMNATEADIQAIKDLASAQQALGVVGDEVQLAGAKELALHLKQRESLEALIPVMNDLAVKQDGLNVSSQTAQQMALLLGKAMDGNTGALRRAGIVLTDAQDQIMKLGTEEQKVATLAAAVEAKVGGMNAELAKTDAGRAQQAANTLGDMKEQVGSLFSSLQPTITTVAMLGMALTSVGSISTSVMGVIKTLRTTIVSLAASSRAGAVAVNSLKWAIRGLMTATVIGAAIAALTWAIEALFNTADESDAHLGELAAEEEKARDAADRLRRSHEQLEREMNDVRTALALNITRTKDFKGSKAEEKKLVDELNRTYGETMGYFASVSAWYKALTANSEAYCRQMQLEMEVRELANQVAERQSDLDRRKERLLTLSKEDKKETTTTMKQRGVTVNNGVVSPKYVPVTHTKSVPGTSPYEVEREAIAAEDRAINLLKEQIQRRMDAMKSIKMPVTGSSALPTGGKVTTGGDKKELSLIADAKTYDELTNNLRYYDEQLHKTNATDTERMSTLAKQRAATSAARDALEKLIKGYTDAADTPIADGDIKTFDELESKLQYYRKQLNSADATGRMAAQNGINRLEKLRDEWQQVLATLEPVETAVEKLQTFEDLDKAISSLEARRKKASAAELSDIDKQIAAIERKRDALERGSRIAGWQREASELGASFSSTDLDIKVKVSDYGFEALTEKIRQLKKELADVENPVTDEQREAIEGLIGQYERWRAESVKSFGTVQQGWSAVKGIGDGVKGLTDALSGNKDAWSMVTGVIDSAMSIYQSVMAVIGLVQMITQALSGSKEEEATQSTIAGVSEAASSVAAGTAAAVAAPLLKEEAVATTELAAARIFAAHASIPIIGPALAAGYVSTMGGSILGVAGAVQAFADGGVVYGPQLALVGEYAGAGSNPEIIAPLDKLRDLMGDGGGMSGDVRFKIEGRDLVGVLEKRNKLSARR